MIKRYSHINFTPPKTVSSNADLGLRLRKKTGKGGLTTKQAGDLKIGSGVARATSLKNRSKISPEVIKRMVNFFNRHETYKKNHIKKEPYSASYISWLLWGGDAGQVWSNKVLRQIKKADENQLAEKTLQTVIVKKTPNMTLEKAKEKLEKAGGKFYKVDEKEGSYYFRQKDPALFIKDSFASFEIPEQGVILIYASLKRKEAMSEFRSSPFVIKFSEEMAPADIQILRAGKFFHDGREIEVDSKDLENMVKNFSENVRGIDLMIDFSHNSEGEAAGWIRKLKLSEDKKELWAVVEWTPTGKKSLDNKAFKYISADFSFAYKDNETLKDYGPTLFGAGLTNRPVVKSMEPIVLSENKPINLNKDNFMYGDAKEMEEKEKMQEEEGKMSLEDAMEMIKALKDDLLKKDEELISIRKELEEGKLKDEQKLAELKKEKELMEKNQAFDKKLSEGVVVEAQREAFIQNDMEKFLSLHSEIKLSETGNNVVPKESKLTKENFEDKIIELAEKRAKDENISLDIAISDELKKHSEESKLYL
jgi:phage I-like protein